jgi:hypothetical protein
MLVGTGVFTRDLFWEDDFLESSEKSLSSDSLAFLFGICLSFLWFFFVIEDDAFFFLRFQNHCPPHMLYCDVHRYFSGLKHLIFWRLSAFFRLNFAV